MSEFKIERDNVTGKLMISPSRSDLKRYCYCFSEKELYSIFEEFEKFKKLEKEKELIKDRKVRRLNYLLGAIYGRLKSIEDSLIIGDMHETNILNEELSKLNNELEEEEKC